MGKRAKTDRPKVTLAMRLQGIRNACVTIWRTTLQVTYVALWLGLAGGAVYGLYASRDYTLRLPQYQKPARIHLANLPSWLNLDANRHIVHQIYSAASLTGADRFTDHSIAQNIQRNLAGCPWVEHVVSVRKQHDGVLHVECDYRRPTAWVQQGDKCYLIDRHGVRLPEAYHADSVEDSKLLVITGVAASPPEPGQPWEGEDLQAGLRQVAILSDAVSRHIAAIDVSNYRGWRDPEAPDIRLYTADRQTEIRWGHAPGEEYEQELTAADKLRVLEENLRRYGRIDGNGRKAYLDVRTMPAFQPAERSSESEGMRSGAMADRS